MPQDQVQAPVALIIFNRPEPTKQVFARIAQARPRKLLVIADGPRSHVSGEAERCLATRRVVENIDWDCEVKQNYADSNLGCRNRVSSGLEWIFSQEERAIILEDDCLPAPGFFRYCDELLERYKDEQRVMTICGTNLLHETRCDDSYLFTTHCSIWGWATWRRAFATYDVNLESWAARRNEDPFSGLPLWPKEVKGLMRTLDNLAEKDPAKRTLDTWDFQWFYNCYIHRGLAITPRSNLISNIGFGADATHTMNAEHKLANIPYREMEFPLRHPASIELSQDYETTYYRKMIRKDLSERIRNAFARARRKLRKAR